MLFKPPSTTQTLPTYQGQFQRANSGQAKSSNAALAALLQN